MHIIDILCIQETWLPDSRVALQVPGFQVFEQRRPHGNRGGIAIMVRKGIKVRKVVGNEYAQSVEIQLPTGDSYWVCNSYLPPSQNLARRNIGEEIVRASLLDALTEVPHNAQLIVCGDFNTRIGEQAPTVGEVQLTRVSADSKICNRGEWLVSTCAELGLHVLNG